MPMTPINSSSLSIGTVMSVRTPARSAKALTAGLPSRYGSVIRKSSVCIRSFVLTNVIQQQVTELGPADTGRVFQHGAEHRLQLAWRAGDDTQHLRRRGLLLQRLCGLPPCLGKLPPCLVSVTLCFRELAGPGFQLLLQSFD